MKLWIILDIGHGCHTFMNMSIYVVILSISWPVLCIRLLRTIVLTWIQIVHLFYHISFYDLPIGWWNYPNGVIFFVFHLILTNVLYLTNNSWALRAILQFVKRSITTGHYHILVTLICHFDRSAKNYLLYDNQHTYIIFRQYDWKESGTNTERNLEAYIILDWPWSN